MSATPNDWYDQMLRIMSSKPAAGSTANLPMAMDERERRHHLKPPIPRRKQSTPVLAYRSWKLTQTDDGWRLVSPQQGTVWDGPILRADNPPDDVSPWSQVSAFAGFYGTRIEGNHGIYAWTLIRGPLDRYENAMRAEGVVELVGKVVRHEKGYRAEMCRIKSLQVFGLDHHTQDAVQDLRATYACEVAPGVEVDEDNIRIRTVDPAECPVCEKRHPDDPLQCQDDSEGGALVDRGGESYPDHFEPEPCDSLSPPAIVSGSMRMSVPTNIRAEYDVKTGTYTVYYEDD